MPSGTRVSGSAAWTASTPLENAWQEIVVEDKRATPADTAACRLDFAAWLVRLPERHRRVAELLAASETTTAVARHVGLTPARISQIRRELHDAWRTFQGEATLAGQAAAA